MTTQSELIQLLRSNPSDENINIAIDWIKIPKQRDKSTMPIVDILLNLPEAGPHLFKLTPWIKSSRLICLVYNQRIPTLEHLDWRLSVLEKFPTHPKAGQIWSALLSSYSNEELVSRAATWLLEHGENDLDAGSVAGRLVDELSSPEIIAFARKRLEQQPNDFLLARSLLYRAPDEKTIDTAIQILETQDPIVGSIVAAALSKSGERGAITVEKFLNTHRDSRKFIRILESLVFEAPDMVFPRFNDWMTKHPKSSEGKRLMVDLICQESPSQEYVNLLWAWFKRNGKKAEILDVITIFSTEFQVPIEVVTYARDWLDSNEGHSAWSLVLVKVLNRSDLIEQLDILKRLHPRLSESELKGVITIIAKQAHKQNKDQSELWNEISHILGDSAFVSPQLKEDVTTQVKSVDSAPKPEFGYPLANEVLSRDPASIQAAKDWLTVRRLEFRWSPLLKCKAEIIAALLMVSPDPFVLEHASRWLERRSELHSETIYEKIQTLYEQCT